MNISSMKINPFKLERYFAKYEFSVPYLMCSSDCEALTMEELTLMADSDSLKMWYDLKLGYTESQGHPILRDEIAQLYSLTSLNDILVLTPEEGIYIAMNSLLKAGDHVITTFPGYQSLYELAVYRGCETSKWMPEVNTSREFKISDLRALIKENTKLIVINFPHNPTGALISEEELKQIILLCEQHNIVLFSDEMYKYLEYNKDDTIPFACDLYENAVSLFGMSKSFALAGLRIGWLTTRNKDFMEQFITYKDYTTICNSAPSEILAIMGLRAKDQIIRRNLSIINSNLDLLDQFFEKYSEFFTWYKPQAGPIAFPKLIADIDVSEFCKNLVEKKGIMLLPSTQYNYEGNNFRIGFARKNIPKIIDIFSQYLDKM